MLLACLGGVACAEPAVDSAATAAPHRRAAIAPDEPPGAALGDGYLVWESNRSGRWRLWIRDLGGGEPRQLTPDERRWIHCCPHVSPDGEQIAFLSLPPDQDGYPAGGAVGAMRLIRPDGSGLREILTEARTYYENRAAVWRSPTELIYIEPSGHTASLDLTSGVSSRLTARPAGDSPWLINSRLTWAASGLGGLATYDPETRLITEHTPLRGCQPYFSHDGRWGFWVVAPGGPIDRLSLDSGLTSTLLRKSDQRLPAEFGYLYFPMLSRDGRLLAFAASRNEHAHFKADYEIFVVETDPDTLEILQEPVRITNHPATDRFPDVFAVPLPLGSHRGEAPFTWSSRPSGREEEWRWSFGDGTGATGPIAEHTFEKPGIFTVEAASGGRLLRGRIRVAPARPPGVVAVSLLGNGREVAVVFDEPIDIRQLAARLESGVGVSEPRLDTDDRRLRLRLAAPIRGEDRLVLEGIQDRAQRPNRMPVTPLAVAPPWWPADRRGLAFLWETGDAPNLLYDPALGSESAVILEAKGTARLDNDFALLPAGGRFAAPAGFAQRITRDCQDTYELTLEATIEPDPSLAGGGSGIILTTASRSRRSFILEQRGRRLVVGIRMGYGDPPGLPTVPLFELPAGRRSHVVVAYSPGRLTAYLDGEPRITDASIEGGFFQWREAPLVLGSDWNGARPWRGKLEGIAIYNRELEAEEARENFLRYRSKLEARTPIERWLVTATRVDCSEAPSLEAISPYREALSVCEYRVHQVLQGASLNPLVRVARWSILDGERLRRDDASGAATEQLELTRLSDNPQLESVYLADTLPPLPAAPLFYLVGS